MCPEGLYAPATHSCTWEPPPPTPAPATSTADATAGGSGAEGGAGAASKEPQEEEETCALCRFLKGGGCAEEFEPFNACVKQATADGTQADCMHLFGPMVECMTRDAEKKEYYKGFLEDFKHLEKDHAEEIKAIRAARKN